jgi:hypothetical protein
MPTAMKRTSGATHDCAVPTCGLVIAIELLMCKAHWFQVPEILRDEVWQTWRRVQRVTSGPDRLPLIKAYLEARRKAVASIKAA